MVCPKCNGHMQTYNRNGVQIEQCGNCRGIFLDYGELETLTRVEGQWAAAPPPQAYPGPGPQQYPAQPGYPQPAGPAWGAPQQHGGGYAHGQGHGHGQAHGHGGRHNSFAHMLFSS
ncbi:zf-TFIIB domain-containing protein [Streptomyces sp. CA-111067]|uniref:TFIIB-type zinc ribbon-containing protein n=1 Tax=Streptomyces sp. CA-111067 TaxID=3240046 RepID=UPI003D9732B4